MLIATLFVFVVLAVSGNDVTATSCGPSTTEAISFAGPQSLQVLVESWKDGYQKICPNNEVVVEGRSSSDGASRVCGTRTGAAPVDIGGLSRRAMTDELQSDNGWQYDCERSTRSTIEVDVAVEGISLFVTKDGPAFECIDYLGGLTSDQVRWIFSNLSQQDLVANGWDSTSVPYSDGDENTHLWSELHQDCEPIEIVVGGEPDGTLAHKYFVDTVLGGETEMIDTNRNVTYYQYSSVPDIADFLEGNDQAIAFVALGYALSTDNREALRELESVPILNGEGDFTKPNFAAIQDSAYLLSRRLIMHIYNDESSLAQTRPFLEFGYSEEGSQLINSNGFFPIHEWEKIVMRTRLETESGIPMDDIKKFCGPEGGMVSVDGGSTLYPFTVLWAAVYEIGCGVTFDISRTGSKVGAGRVCDDPEKGTPVDIANMIRDWKITEAEDAGEYLHKCAVGDTERSTIQVKVATDAVAVAVQKGGSAARCIDIIGGLTMDQLRWIYSDYSDQQLEESGWDPSSLPNSDGSSATHLWSELDERCEHVEIRISGPEHTQGTYFTLRDTVLIDHENGESFGTRRPAFGYFNSPNMEHLIGFTAQFEEAITYFSYAFYFEFGSALNAVPLENHQGELVEPTFETIGGGSYTTMTRTLYMNPLNDDSSLVHTVPFVKFGLSQPDLVAVTGNVPIQEVDEMNQRLDKAPYSLEGGSSGLSVGIIVGIAVAGVVVLCVAVVLGYMFCIKGDKGPNTEEQPV